MNIDGLINFRGNVLVLPVIKSHKPAVSCVVVFFRLSMEGELLKTIERAHLISDYILHVLLRVYSD
jgi:hypothetical protein